MSSMCPVVHFEMPYEEPRRVAKFYESVFGWQTNMLGGNMGDYILAATTESRDGRPMNPGAINGGFFPKKPDWPAQHPGVVIAVEDIEDAIRRVNEAGGEVLGMPVEIPSVGRYVSFYDTERNRVALLQPFPRR